MVVCGEWRSGTESWCAERAEFDERGAPLRDQLAAYADDELSSVVEDVEMSDPAEGRLADAAHRLRFVAKRRAKRVELCARHSLSGTDADGARVGAVEHARRTGHGAALLRRTIGVSECRLDLGLREEGAGVDVATLA